MLRQSPAVYKIPAQKNAEGRDIAEGTLVFDKESNTLQIEIGKPFYDADPVSVFKEPAPEMQEATQKVSAKSKLKKPAQPKTWKYTGTKLIAETVSN